jgi:hypothetical protein
MILLSNKMFVLITVAVRVYESQDFGESYASGTGFGNDRFALDTLNVTGVAAAPEPEITR